MAIWLPILILVLVLATIHKGGHERKGDLGFVVVILVIAALVLGTRF